jgi:hypothetical protein
MQKFNIPILLIVFLSLVQPVFAQNIAQNFPQFPFSTFWNPDALATFLGVPAEWLSVPKVIYYVIVPFIVAFTVTYGILTELRIFRTATNKVNIILAFAMSFLLLPSGVLTIIVTYFYAANAFIGLMGFGLLFLFGTLMWVYGRARGIRHEVAYHGERVGQLRNQLNHLDREIQQLTEDIYRRRSNGATEEQLRSRIERLDHLRQQQADYEQRIHGLLRPT